MSEHDAGGEPTRPILTSGAQDALAELIDKHEHRRSPDVLTVLPILSELALVLDGFASGRDRIFKSDRKSLACDADLALTRVGNSLGEFTTPTLSRLRTDEVSRLAEVFQDRDDAEALAITIRGVLDQLRAPAAVGAAWDDVLAAMADGAATTACCALRVAQLAELVRVRGHDWSSIKTDLTSAVVHDDLGAGREAAMTDAPSDAAVVWVAFGNAHLEEEFRRVGQVQFFGDQLTLQDIRDGAPALARPEFEQATELTDEAIEWHFSDIDAQYYVFARVELAGSRAQLPPGGTGPPIAWARQFVSGVVEAAGFRIGGTDWLLLDGGCCFFSDDSRSGSAGFTDPIARKALESFRPAVHEPTGEALGGLQPEFADALARGEPSAVRAVSGVGWHRRAEAIEDDAMRLALHVRGFESQWASGPGREFGSWEEPVHRFFRDLWSRNTIENALFSAASTIELPPLPLRLQFASDQEGVAAARAEVFIYEDERNFTWKPGAVLRLAPTVAAYFVVGSPPRRLWKELARVGRTGESAQRWWEQLRTVFDVMLNRAVRQRNAIVHGRELVPEVIASVEPFLNRVSSYLAAQAVDAAAHGYDIDERLESNRARLDDHFEKLVKKPSGLALWPEA
jgi:hypothetical protein